MAQPEFLNVKTRSVSRLFYIAHSVLIREHPGVLAQHTFAPQKRNAPRWRERRILVWRFLGTFKIGYCSYDKGNTGLASVQYCSPSKCGERRTSGTFILGSSPPALLSVPEICQHRQSGFPHLARRQNQIANYDEPILPAHGFEGAQKQIRDDRR
jgi:hypothetical protein